MAKNIGILIDPETGDLQIDPRRNDQNVYVQGPVSYTHLTLPTKLEV